jgi:hypothetical protein
MKSLLGLLAAACLASISAAAQAPATGLVPPRTAMSARSALPAPTTTHHYIANIGRPRAVKRLGFTVLDTGDSRAEINALPKGTQALVWLGQGCPTRITDAFRRQVSRLATNPRVFGYYLSDEPDVAGCPHGPAALATRARYIRRVSHRTQKSFVVLSDSSSYHAYRPAVSRVSMVGLDPYPCSIAHPRCAFGKIHEKVTAALRAGIPLGSIVPVYQVFGQEHTSDHYYNLPTGSQLRTMLDRWAALVPHPKMDYSYGWGHQDSANPTLRDSPTLQAVLQAYFAG